MGLKPWEFWELTPREFTAMAEAYQAERECQVYETASILAAIYNTIPRKKGSKTYKAEDFISQKKAQPPSEEELKNKLVAMFGPGKEG